MGNKSNDIVTFEELQKMTGFEAPHQVANCLRREGIKFLNGKRGIVYTTIGAIESAMGMSESIDTQGAKAPAWRFINEKKKISPVCKS